MGERDWLGVLLGRIVVPIGQDRPPYWRENRVHRQIWFSSFNMSDENLPSYVAKIRRRGLRFLEGYPSTLYILGSHLLRCGDRLPMAAVLTSSETLHPVQREVIEEAFQCRVFDFYGLAERVAFAGECQVHDGLHLSEEFAFVEIVDESGRRVPDGDRGFVVGTSLHNRAMPMIRYRTSDVSAIRAAECSCGRALRVLEPITTKAEDVVVTPDGRFVSPSVLPHPFKPLVGIAKSQIVQEALDRVVVKLIPAEADIPRDQVDLLQQGLLERLGSQVSIEVEIVEEIPPERSGKFRWVISRVPTPDVVDWNQVNTR
jgi:phenylacetate-CoA ligase